MFASPSSASTYLSKFMPRSPNAPASTAQPVDPNSQAGPPATQGGSMFKMTMHSMPSMSSIPSFNAFTRKQVTDTGVQRVLDKITEVLGPEFKGDAPVRNVTFSFERKEICSKITKPEDFAAALKKAAHDATQETSSPAQGAATGEQTQQTAQAAAEPGSPGYYDPKWKIIDLLNCPNAIAFLPATTYSMLKMGNEPVPAVLIDELKTLLARLHEGSLQMDRDKSLIGCTLEIAEIAGAPDLYLGCINSMCSTENLTALKTKLFEKASCNVYYMKSQLETMFHTLGRFNFISQTDLVDTLKGILFRSKNLLETINKDAAKTWEEDKKVARDALENIIKESKTQPQQQVQG